MPPRFYADLHIHSKYSRACSRDLDTERLTWWAKRKGITLLGTGDFTHPAWYEHLRETLEPAEPGLYRLATEKAVDATLPGALQHGSVRFMLSVEISTIYKRDGATRKVHHLVYLPDLEAAARFNTALGRIGNLASDGRPILGLDSRDLLEITLEASPDGYLVPAHIWTPWFAALGSKSGFDAIADCYADLADHIFAVETGLSSDPPMNWRVSSLDGYTLVSNSDAHSPPALAREAHAYTTELDYYAVKRALETGDGYAGSIEFFPEEGKYHADGHRACNVRMTPAETIAAAGRCHGCGKPVTVGVLSRIEELADRPEGVRPAKAAPFTNLLALPEIVGEIHSVGAKSKTVLREVDALVAALGPELGILQDVPADEVAKVGGERLGEAITRLRRGEVIRESGYDGEYGVIRLFEPAELADAAPLFELSEPARPKAAAKRTKESTRTVVSEVATEALAEVAADAEPPLPLDLPDPGLLKGLDAEQRAAAEIDEGPVLIVAGPGTGKTRTLTHRIAHAVVERGVAPEHVLALTFTRRAAEEMRERLAVLCGPVASRLTVSTFHALALRLVTDHYEELGLAAEPAVAGDAERAEVLAELGLRAADVVPGGENRAMYVKELRARNRIDIDDLVRTAVELLSFDPDVAGIYRRLWTHVSVDEYQDVDEAQYRMLRLLVPPNGDIMAIGDPDQAIYSFRGSDVGYFMRFERDYMRSTRIALTRNYRSAAPIVAAAVQAVRPSSLVPGRSLTATRRDLGAARIGLHQAPTDTAEAGYVAKTIDGLVGGSSFNSLDSGRVDGRSEPDEHHTAFGDIAVLYRTAAQAEAVMSAFDQAAIPYQKRGHDRLIDRPGVPELVRELPHAGAGPVADRVRAAARTVAARAMTPDLFATDEPAADPRGVLTWSAADLLAPLAERSGDDLDEFLQAVVTGAEVDTLDPRADTVSLLTLHAAKGLEFPVVFLVGCVDGILPLRWPGQAPDPESEAEERRLFFVGITRAERRLYLSSARQTGRRSEAVPSPFLSVLADGLLDRSGDAVARRPQPRQMRLI